jgi:hypothetical protein
MAIDPSRSLSFSICKDTAPMYLYYSETLRYFLTVDEGA